MSRQQEIKEIIYHTVINGKYIIPYYKSYQAVIQLDRIKRIYESLTELETPVISNKMHNKWLP